jgi:hypothetical protein
MCKAEDQALSERRAVPSCNMASNSALAMVSRSGASHRGQQVTGGPRVGRMWWAVLWQTSYCTLAGRVKSGNSARRLSIGVSPMMVLMLGTSALAAWAGTDDVTPSRSRLFRQSTRRPRWERVHTDDGSCDVTTTNRHVKSQRKPKLGLSGSHL